MSTLPIPCSAPNSFNLSNIAKGDKSLPLILIGSLFLNVIVISDGEFEVFSIFLVLEKT